MGTGIIIFIACIAHQCSRYVAPPLSPPPPLQDQYIEEGIEWEYVPVQTNDALVEAFQQVTPCMPDHCCANNVLLIRYMLP